MREVLNSEPSRADGRWVVQPAYQWVPCPCTPGPCRSSSHPHFLYDDYDVTTTEGGEFDSSEEDEMSDCDYDAMDESRFSIVSHSDDAEVTEPSECDFKTETDLHPTIAEGRCCGAV